MNKHFKKIICKATGASELVASHVIQTLWSGYGQIVRYELKGSTFSSVVVKHVQLINKKSHPRNWDTDRSHLRKLKSYEVETAWYKKWSNHCGDACRVPKCLAIDSMGDEVLIVLEDLDASGFLLRKSSLTWDEMKTCLSWLAHFHATFMGEQPDQLWKNGTYWHLDTRPDELNVLNDLDLKKAAHLIDLKLKKSPFRTFLHGDAKLANFCFSKDGKQVAAVDFQYVGGGCGMKDLAYFIGSCLDEDESEHWEKDSLDFYFKSLKLALKDRHPSIARDALEQDWRALYPLAWTDFHRFLKGWSPGHWKINSYSERLARNVIKQFQTEAEDL